MQTKVETPYLIALNLTRRCNLACAHCYLDARILKEGSTDELSTKEITELLEDIAAFSPETMIVLTGGEPLLRGDIEVLVAIAAGLGLMVVIGSNGLMLTPARVERLKGVGLHGIGLSLDSLKPERHDSFRGRKGAWSKTMAAIDACVAAQMPFQLHFSVTDETAGEIDDMVAFARDSGTIALNVFFMVCTGRGETYSDISPQKYEQILTRVVHAARVEDRLMVRAKCAPHFKRIATEMDPNWPITSAHGYDAGGCIAGIRYARVTPDGYVTPCPYMDNPVGSVRETSFAKIWNEAPVLNALRAPRLEGRCGPCEYRELCGGCRARPLAKYGNLMGEDFLCTYQPRGGPVIGTDAPVFAPMGWSDEAERRVARVPGFVRRMVRRRAEDHVRAEGRATVTVADLELLVRRSFGDAGAPARPSDFGCEG